LNLGLNFNIKKLVKNMPNRYSSDSNRIHLPPDEPTTAKTAVTAEPDHPSIQPPKPSPPDEFDDEPPQKTPDDWEETAKLQEPIKTNSAQATIKPTSELNKEPSQSQLPTEVFNPNRKKENNDDNTKISKIKKTIKKIKNLFRNLWCQFFESSSKTELPPRESTPSPIVSALGESPRSPIELTSRPSSPSEIKLSSKPFPPTLTTSSPEASPTYPKLTTPRASTDNKKIEMFNYLVNATDINFDKIKIDDKNKINCFEILFDEINDDKVELFKRIYKKEGLVNSGVNSLISMQKIKEKKEDTGMKIELFNLINEKLKFDEKDLKDDKRIDIVNFFIKGIILNKNKIQNKLVEKIKEEKEMESAGARSAGR